MHAIRLPNDNLLIPVESQEADAHDGLIEITPNDLEYAIWLAVATDGTDPRERCRAKHRKRRQALTRPTGRHAKETRILHESGFLTFNAKKPGSSTKPGF
jgi:hypothetical protein